MSEGKSWTEGMGRGLRNQARQRENSEPKEMSMTLIIPNPKLKLLDQVREVMRLKHLIRLVPTNLTLAGFSCC